MIQRLATQTAQEHQINCSSSCRAGTLSTETVAVAHERQAGLVVMGTQIGADLLVITAGLVPAAANYFTGSFTQQIIHNTTIPVLFIRPDTDAEQQATRVFWQYGRDDPGLSAIGL